MSSCDILCMKTFCRFTTGRTKTHSSFFCCVKTASVLPKLTAGSRIVLHQKCAILSGCNIRSCVDSQAWEFVPLVRKCNLVVDETLVFVVAPT